MAGPDDTDGPSEGGFLSRWSRRKVLVRQGAALPEPPAPSPAPSSGAVPTPVPTPAGRATQALPDPALPQDLAVAPPTPEAERPSAAAAPPPPPAPTLADVAELTHRSDFSRFVAPGVDSGVKNAALKKLFTDPHFNVMDRLDTYIDDYGLPDPLPAGMLRQMAQSQFLGLFSDEAVAPAAAAPADPLLDGPPAADPTALPEPHPDEDADLRLQPLDAAGPAGPDPGAGADPGRQH